MSRVILDLVGFRILNSPNMMSWSKLEMEGLTQVSKNSLVNPLRGDQGGGGPWWDYL